MDEQRQTVRTWLIGVIAAVLVVFLLERARVVFLPLFAAFFLAVLLQPMEAWFRRRLPGKIDWLALVPPMLTLLAVAALGAAAFYGVYHLSRDELPRYETALRDAADRARSWANQAGLDVGGGGSDLSLSSYAGDVARRVATSSLAVVSGLVVIFFLVLLMLVEDPRWPGKLRAAVGEDRAGKVIDTTRDVAGKVRTYLLVRLFLSVLSGALAGGWLFVMGVPLAWGWAMLIVVLNFVPNLGSVIAVIPPTLAALAAGGATNALVVLAGLAAIEQVIGNFVDPRLQGSRLRLSPVLVLVSVLFWTWLWGPAGALLAVPIAASLVAAASHVPALRPLATLGCLDERGQGR